MQTSFDDFKKLITADTTNCYIYGLPASFMFDDADDTLNIYFIQHDEDCVTAIKISENPMVNFYNNEAWFCGDDGAKVTITMFQEISMDIHDALDKLDGKY